MLVLTDRMATRREALALQTRAELLDVASRLFATHGFAGVSIDAICAEFGLSRGGFYHHFADKTACFEAVWTSHQERFLQAAPAPSPANDPATLVVAELRRFLDHCQEPAFARICLIDAPGALGWARWRQLEDDYGLNIIGGGLEVLGKQHDPPTTKLVFAMVVEAALQLAQPDAPATLRDDLEAALLAIIDGLPDAA